MQYDISVVIPTYNVEKYILQALDSVVNQMFGGTIEILLIDDCSTDNTMKIIEEYKENNPQNTIKILQQEKNMRQGTARNRGIKEAQGKYVFFLDGDDFLDVHALEKMFAKAEKENCDFVVCDWAYYYEDKGLVYVNNDDFLFQDSLEGEKCEKLLEAVTYFSVNKLYNRAFLLNNEIVYGEGYIYEDYEFYVDVAQKANKVGIVQNPFYLVRVNDTSTTKTNTKSLLHVESLVKAVEATIRKFNPRWVPSYYYLYKYIMTKTLDYSEKRAPIGHKKTTLKKVLEILNKKNKNYYIPMSVAPLYYFLFRRKYVQKAEVRKILFIYDLHLKGKLRPLFQKAMKTKEFFLKNESLAKLNKKRLDNKKQKEIKSYYTKPVKKNVVLFLGFDYRYAGNSKYFYDYMMAKDNKGLEIYFVTKNSAVPSKNRITPRTLKFYKALAEAKIVFAESWVPLDFTKREGQHWIQLWHGTPFKKVFFDSHEKYISMYNKNHKRDKQKDISKWDNLLADSDIGQEKLASSFAYDTRKILNIGYPRVQWLKENQSNEALKNDIKKQIGIEEGKKVVLYVPTWRDYNYKENELDLEYVVNIEKMAKELGEDYVILNKQHSMGRFPTEDKAVITPSDDMEVQNLVLISDMVISDYSSIIFDAMAIDVPFYLFINDFEKYADARGVYEDMDAKLRPFYIEDELELFEKIKTVDADYPTVIYNEVKETYAMKATVNSNVELQKKVYDITLVNN